MPTSCYGEVSYLLLDHLDRDRDRRPTRSPTLPPLPPPSPPPRQIESSSSFVIVWSGNASRKKYLLVEPLVPVENNEVQSRKLFRHSLDLHGSTNRLVLHPGTDGTRRPFVPSPRRPHARLPSRLPHPQQRASSYYGPATPSACASMAGGSGTEPFSPRPTVRLEDSLLRVGY